MLVSEVESLQGCTADARGDRQPVQGDAVARASRRHGARRDGAAILATLRGGTGRVTSEVAKVIGLTPRATRTRMFRLVERGLVREVGTSPQDPKRRYSISS